jgi:hypothetical protein
MLMSLGTGGGSYVQQFGVSPTGIVTFGGTGLSDRLIVSPVAKGANQFDGTNTSADLTAARTWTLPDATGTLALTSAVSVTYTTITSLTVTNGIVTAIVGS